MSRQEELARQAAKRSPACVWTSNLGRAMATAEPIASELGLPITVDRRLAESNPGRWEGVPLEQIEREEPDLWSAWRRAGSGFSFPGGESLAAHSSRVIEVMRELDAGPKPAVVICHGGTIRCALAAVSHDGLDGFHRPEVPHATIIEFEPARIGAIR